MSVNNAAFPTTAEQSGTYPERGLTKREYAAIHLQVPDSGDPELDEMIKRARLMVWAAKELEK